MEQGREREGIMLLFIWFFLSWYFVRLVERRIGRTGLMGEERELSMCVCMR